MIAQLVNLDLQVSPSEDGVRTAPLFANSIQAVADLDGVTLYFFSLPPDATALEEVKAAIDASASGTSPPKVVLRLDPVAKVYIQRDCSHENPRPTERDRAGSRSHQKGSEQMTETITTITLGRDAPVTTFSSPRSPLSGFSFTAIEAHAVPAIERKRLALRQAELRAAEFLGVFLQAAEARQQFRIYPGADEDGRVLLSIFGEGRDVDVWLAMGADDFEYVATDGERTADERRAPMNAAANIARWIARHGDLP